MKESETREGMGLATLLVPGALFVKVECLQGAPSLAQAFGGMGGGRLCNHMSHVTHQYYDVIRIECWQIVGQALPSPLPSSYSPLLYIGGRY